MLLIILQKHPDFLLEEESTIQHVAIARIIDVDILSNSFLDMSCVRAFSLGIYLMMWGFIIYIISYMVFRESHHVETSSLAMKVMIGSCVMIPLLWLIILIETLYCDEFHYLGNIKDSANINDFLERMKNLEPGILFTATCWHYEKKNSKSREKRLQRAKSHENRIVPPKGCNTQRLPSFLLYILG